MTLDSAAAEGESFFLRATVTYGAGGLAVDQAAQTVTGSHADPGCQENPDRFPLSTCAASGVSQQCARNCGNTFRQCVFGQTVDTVSACTSSGCHLELVSRDSPHRLCFPPSQELGAGALCFDGSIIHDSDARCAPECPVVPDVTDLPTCDVGETTGIVCYPANCGIQLHQCVHVRECIQV